MRQLHHAPRVVGVSMRVERTLSVGNVENKGWIEPILRRFSLNFRPNDFLRNVGISPTRAGEEENEAQESREG